ncbi:hypothetical protein M199_gp040 [Halogranum tailed virus 1]|uniref:Uncharacterized protein n=1 Tax=Halogranum tailed virus 1 TaxID=1273749 RepID=R4T8Z4_9CAUD|nr:hypothetical protein M199_gp040 [Halogranum tailed virus 1]AGM11370.1 hypothetical protein HGTV1_40 [Halogranum tailed virus 1]
MTGEIMGQLDKDLKSQGFERTERSSPFHDDGTLWANSHELVCDETGIVVRSQADLQQEEKTVAELSESTPRYSNSGRVILPGGHKHVYDWGEDDEGEFIYEKV